MIQPGIGPMLQMAALMREARASVRSALQLRGFAPQTAAAFLRHARACGRKLRELRSQSMEASA